MFHTTLLLLVMTYFTLTSLGDPRSWGYNLRGARGSGPGRYYYPAADRMVRWEAHQGKMAALLGLLVPLGTSGEGQAADRIQAEGILPAEDTHPVAGTHQEVGTQAARMFQEAEGSPAQRGMKAVRPGT